MGLVFRERFVGTGLDDVEEFLSRTYTGLAMRPTGDPSGLLCRHDTTGATGFAVTRLQMSMGYRGRLDGMDGLLTVVSVRDGGFSWSGRRYGEVAAACGDTLVAPPVGAFTSANAADSDLEVVTFDAAAMADYAAHTCGGSPADLRLTGLSPISATLGRYWNATVAHVRDDVLGNPVAAASPLLVENAYRMLATALLSTFPNTGADPGRRAPRGAVPEVTLREVIDYLGTHAHQPVGPADVAAVAGRPAREVVAGLRRRYGTHPSRLLWQARLLGVRRELHDADPVAGVSVAAVAARWGFARPARFRVAYLKAFGEAPEDTLRR